MQPELTLEDRRKKEKTMEQRLSGRTALITGAGSGIGAASAERLAAEGAKLALVDIDSATAEKVADGIKKAGGEAIALVADVTQSDQVNAVFEETLRQYKRLDVLFANAGIMPSLVPVGDCPEESWRKVLDVNLTGVFLCVKAALPVMRKQKRGVILATSSMAGVAPSSTGIEYNVAKTGVIMLIKHLAYAYGRYGIRAVAICPGWVDTPLLKSVYDAFGRPVRSSLQNASPLGRMATPMDVAASVAFLASDEASFISGNAFLIDGATTAGTPVLGGPIVGGYLALRSGIRRLQGKPSGKLIP
jgi:NAD(P)-dependent dehydrogenase (short-subunit alcohol dehydrogenase family)